MRARLYIAALVIVALGAVGYYVMPQKAPTPWPDHSVRTLTIDNKSVQVEVVSTDASRQMGLSGRSGLAPETGMLFVFDTDNSWGFWMKDMRFSIDMVWLSADGTVVTIAPSVEPDTYPQIIYPQVPARYVLEFPAGFAQAHNLAVGQPIQL